MNELNVLYELNWHEQIGHISDININTQQSEVMSSGKGLDNSGYLFNSFFPIKNNNKYFYGHEAQTPAKPNVIYLSGQ